MPAYPHLEFSKVASEAPVDGGDYGCRFHEDAQLIHRKTDKLDSPKLLESFQDSGFPGFSGQKLESDFASILPA